MKFQKETVKIENFFLDPNNPRFADISDDALNIPISRFTESSIQENTYQKMLHPRFDIISLAKSIETVGFLPVDNIVVNKINKSDFIIVEGNRRITAVKYLINQYNIGQSLLNEEDFNLLKEFDVLVIADDNIDQKYVGMVVQGVRNVSGIKEWDAFQKAQFIDKLVNNGKDPNTISKMIGMKVRNVNRYYKTFSAMNQFKEDEEFNEAWKLSHFSHFDELIKKPALRNYFGWDDDNFLFNNLERIRRFYDWLTPDENGKTTFGDHKDVRKLAELITDNMVLNYLDDKNLDKAINIFEQKNLYKDIVSFDECVTKINDAIKAFKNIIAEGYENEFADDEVDVFENSIIEMNNQINRIKTLRNNG
ncbi:MAG: ParB N-terminal domain-containing protein [Bacteroidetes bacterium]|nr:ParB N-terminal domain-containing protein [Bacteroidota bacterium]